MIALAGPCVKSACPSQYSNCLVNSGPTINNNNENNFQKGVTDIEKTIIRNVNLESLIFLLFIPESVYQLPACKALLANIASIKFEIKTTKIK